MATTAGRCGEKVGFLDDVAPEALPPEMGRKAFIRWLISSRDGAPTFSMRFFEVGVGGSIHPHHHPWEHEIFVLSGEGRIRIGSTWYRVSGGMFIYIPPNVEHEYVNTGGEALKFLCLIPNEATAPRARAVRC